MTQPQPQSEPQQIPIDPHVAIAVQQEEINELRANHAREVSELRDRLVFQTATNRTLLATNTSLLEQLSIAKAEAQFTPGGDGEAPETEG